LKKQIPTKLESELKKFQVSRISKSQVTPRSSDRRKEIKASQYISPVHSVHLADIKMTNSTAWIKFHTMHVCLICGQKLLAVYRMMYIDDRLIMFCVNSAVLISTMYFIYIRVSL